MYIAEPEQVNTEMNYQGLSRVLWDSPLRCPGLGVMGYANERSSTSSTSTSSIMISEGEVYLNGNLTTAQVQPSLETTVFA